MSQKRVKRKNPQALPGMIPGTTSTSAGMPPIMVAFISAAKDGCTCKTCAILRKMTESAEDELVGDEDA